MTRVRAFVLSMLAGIALSLGSVAQGGTIYDNLSAVSDGADPVNGFGPLADSFSTTAATTLVDVKFLLSAADSTDGGTTSVSLLSDSSTTPGSVIATLGSISDSSLSSSPSVVDITGFTPVSLNAGTRYWIELASGTSSAYWSWSFDTSGVGVANENFANSNGVFPNSDGPYQMQVNTGVSAVPEPSTLTLGILGLGTLVAFRRRPIR